MWLRVIVLTSLIALGCRSISGAQTCNDYIPASTPDSVFVDNGDSTVTDTRTGLMWKQCVEGLSGTGCTEGSATPHTWQEALQLAETTNTSGGFAGYTDWRLPNIKELESIVERKCYSPSINLTFFPNQSSSGVWSGSAYAFGSSGAWSVSFYDGSDYYYGRSYSYYVRLVRGGQ